jgi:plasmid maintenance system killer protein
MILERLVSGCTCLFQSRAQIFAPTKAEIKTKPKRRLGRFYATDAATPSHKGRYTVDASGNWRVTFGWAGDDAVDVDLEGYH